MYFPANKYKDTSKIYQIERINLHIWAVSPLAAAGFNVLMMTFFSFFLFLLPLFSMIWLDINGCLHRRWGLRLPDALRRNVSNSTLDRLSLSPARALRMWTTKRHVNLCSRWSLDGICREHSCIPVRASPMSDRRSILESEICREKREMKPKIPFGIDGMHPHVPYLLVWCVLLRSRLVHLVRVEHRPNPLWTSPFSVPCCPSRSQSNICEANQLTKI